MNEHRNTFSTISLPSTDLTAACKEHTLCSSLIILMIIDNPHLKYISECFHTLVPFSFH